MEDESVMEEVVWSWSSSEEEEEEEEEENPAWCLLSNAMHDAVNEGNLESLREFLMQEEDVDVDARDRRVGETVLHYSCMEGDGYLELTKLLLDHAANVNAKDSWGRTPLHKASSRGASSRGALQTAMLLIEYGADLNAEDRWRRTPFRLACCHGELQIAMLLIEYGADVNANGFYAVTPLHVVCKKGEVELVRLLIAKGANVHAKERTRGETPFHWAWNYNDDFEVLANLMIEHGADVDSKNNEGRTLLHQACNLGKMRKAKFLLENGADVDSKDAAGLTPFLESLEKRQFEVAEFLLENGADVNEGKHGWGNGDTALHHACSDSDRLEVVQFLLNRGADIFKQTHDRFGAPLTALDCACERNNIEAVWLLVRQYPVQVVNHY